MTRQGRTSRASLSTILLGTALGLLLLALALNARGYARWLQQHRDSTPARSLRQVAGPTASWLPGVLQATRQDEHVLLVSTGMADPDWLTAYYLYPRRLTVITPQTLAAWRALSQPPEAQWVLDRGRLLRWPDMTPVPLEDGPSAALPPAPISARGALALLLTAAAALGWGAFLLSRLGGTLRHRLVTPGRWGLAWLTGLGVLGTAGFVAALVNQAASWWLVALLTGGGLVALWLAGSWLRPADTDDTLSRRGMILVAVVAVLVGLTMVRALGEPMRHWDERFQWAYKAKILLHEGGIHGPGFQAADHPHLHRRYPLLLPALEAHTARLAGGFTQERAVKGLFPLFFLALLLTAHGALRQRLPPLHAWGLTALLAALPPWHLARLIQGGPAHTGFADLPLAAFATGLALVLVPGGLPGERRRQPAWLPAALLAAFCLAVKPEGISFAAAAALVFLLQRHLPGGRPTAREWASCLLVLALLVVPVTAMHLAVPTSGTVGYSGDEDYVSRLSGPALLAGARLNLVPAATAMLAAPFSLRWACIGLLPLLGLVLAAMRRQRFRAAEHGLALLLLVPLAADLLAFTVTGSEVRWHLAVALDRLWLQVAPLMILIAGGQAGRLAAAQPE